ncbi:hypothetical protein BJV78DRAFT_1158281 [Lactifluus subvellereus]|nr:hypothetical protein BJV78DRAFT_1158281 [Lactifluus subvellereus]
MLHRWSHDLVPSDVTYESGYHMERMGIRAEGISGISETGPDTNYGSRRLSAVTGQDELAEDSDSDAWASESGWAFSMVEGTCALDEDDPDSGLEYDDEINSPQTSSCKWKATHGPESDDEIEVIDLEEQVAVHAAESAQQWRDYFTKVQNCYLN